MKNLFFYFLVIITIGTSCTKIPNDGIPTYITLKKPTVETTALEQGSALHDFPDLWIESGGVSYGAYEYPATFPTFLKGEQKVTINPGIYYNESVIERMIYAIYEPFEATYNFVQKDTIEITPVFNFRSSVDFITIEDFESSNNFSNMDRTDVGDPENIENKAGVITISASDLEKNSSTISSLAIPNGKRTYVEFSIKSESFVNVGFKSGTGGTNEVSLAIYKPTYEWHTAYFEVTNFINTVDEDYYHFYIDIQKNNLDLEEKTYIDNFKIMQN